MPKQSPNHVDVHIGRRIRKMRNIRAWSQKELAAQLGVSYQQIQKYERGVNRVGVATLYELARLFDVGPEALLSGIDTGTDTPSGAAPMRSSGEPQDRTLSRQADILLGAFLKIEDPRLRARIVSLAEALAAHRKN